MQNKNEIKTNYFIREEGIREIYPVERHNPHIYQIVLMFLENVK